MGIEFIPKNIQEKYEIHEWKHACAILKSDFPNEWQDLLDLLNEFQLCKSWLVEGGGRKSKVSEFIDQFLYNRGWEEKQFKTSVSVDNEIMDSPTHKIDCYKNTRDPLVLYRDFLQSTGFNEAELVAIESDVDKAVEQAVAFALESPFPDPADVYDYMYSNPINYPA